jgi:hypothetical protein
LRALEGRLVSVILADDSRLEDCVVISAGHARVGSVWLYADGIDVFVPLSRVADFQEASPDQPGRAA